MIHVEFVKVHHLNYRQMNQFLNERILEKENGSFVLKPMVCFDEFVIDSSIVLLWCWWLVGGDDEELTGCLSSVLLFVKTNDVSVRCWTEKGVAIDSLNSIISGVANGTLTWAAVRCLYKWNFISSDDDNLGESIRRRATD